MTTVVAMKAIKPKKLNMDVFRAEWNKVLDDTAQNKLRPDFAETIQTFELKPPIKIINRPRAESGQFVALNGALYRAVYILYEVYFYLARGTRIRWAVMSRDWRSKTKPGRIPSGPGRGHFVIVGKLKMQRRGIRPRPGIKARNFDILIAKKRNRGFVKDVEKATRQAANRAF